MWLHYIGSRKNACRRCERSSSRTGVTSHPGVAVTVAQHRSFFFQIDFFVVSIDKIKESFWYSIVKKNHPTQKSYKFFIKIAFVFSITHNFFKNWLNTTFSFFKIFIFECRFQKRKKNFSMFCSIKVFSFGSLCAQRVLVNKRGFNIIFFCSNIIKIIFFHFSVRKYVFRSL